LTRRPFIIIGDLAIISPQLLLDSLFANTHYSLIESKETKDKYLATQSGSFLDKISGIGEKYGYEEIDREKLLFEGKNTIGDIDLVLKNSEGHHLLIEAKNHALPLGVYFKIPEDTLLHLHYLQNEWEKKVKRRSHHLRNNHHKYGLPNNFTYLVVSRFPEVAAHFSEILMLSIEEFSSWLEIDAKPMSFSEFYPICYAQSMVQFSEDEISRLREDGLFIGEFSEK
jgi:hypothetical protein